MRQAFAILMTVAIFVCPLLCMRGECCVRTEREGGAHGCSCCHGDGAANSGDEHSCPTDPQAPKSGHSCQCICGGAVVDDAGLQVVDFDWSWSLPVAVVEPAVGQLHEALFQQCSLSPWPDVGMNAGRVVCCLYSTYQC